MEVMKKKLILVGNKPPYRTDLNTFIDSFDYVLRISRMNIRYLKTFLKESKIRMK